ncbi:hypothetical protein CTI14_30155, partial [Methylobacterium radiotolerans]
MTDSAPFRFDLLARDGTARTGMIATPRGEIRTPAFMPVGTAATVKAMYPGQVRDLGADVVLGNTYHLMLRPGPERMARLGGLHRFMNWDRPILTDSGGFQVMSLSALRKIDEQGVTFRSHIDGTAHHMSPERSIEIQGLLGSDIQMQLDECVRLPADHAAIEKAMHLSLRWASAAASRSARARASPVRHRPGRGRACPARRERPRADRSRSQGLRGGRPRRGRAPGRHVRHDRDGGAAPAGREAPLPDGRRHAGRHPRRGGARHRHVRLRDADPRGRHGLAYTRHGRVNLRNARHAEDTAPLDVASTCPAARDYSRAYLHHLVRSNEILGMMLLTWNNLACPAARDYSRAYLHHLVRSNEILGMMLLTWNNL